MSPPVLYNKAECNHDIFSSYFVHHFIMLRGLEQSFHFYKPTKFFSQLHKSHCKAALKQNTTTQLFKHVQGIFQWKLFLF